MLRPEAALQKCPLRDTENKRHGFNTCIYHKRQYLHARMVVGPSGIMWSGCYILDAGHNLESRDCTDPKQSDNTHTQTINTNIYASTEGANNKHTRGCRDKAKQ